MAKLFLKGFEQEKEKFEQLFPNLDYFCTKLLCDVFGYKLEENDYEFPKWLLGQSMPERTDIPQPYKSADDMRIKVDNTLNTLHQREKAVLVLRYGLQGYGTPADGLPKSYVEIGQMFELSRTRVQQIEAKALRKLRHQMREKTLFFSEEELKALEREKALLNAENLANRVKALPNQIEINMDFSVLNKSIGECGFSDRTVYVLDRAGYKTVADLFNRVNFYADEPLKWVREDAPLLGRIGADEVIKFLSTCLEIKPYTLLEDIGFSVRTFNCLKRAGFNTIEDVMAKIDFNSDEPFAFLRRVRNFGYKCVDEVVNYILSHDKYQAMIQTIKENVSDKNDLKADKREEPTVDNRPPLEEQIPAATAIIPSKTLSSPEINLSRSSDFER